MGPAGQAFLLSLLLGLSGANEEEPDNLLTSICGRPAVTSGIASGREANVGQWPWQVSIRQGLLHVCAGALISDQWVLTAASCFQSKDVRKYDVSVGSLQVISRPHFKLTLIPVSRVISYPGLQGNIANNIAVVELAYPVSFSPVILPICLPSSADQLKNATSCWVTGWGYSRRYPSVKPSYIMKELRVPLIDLQTCNDYYQNEVRPYGIKSIINENMICSKVPVEQMDPCIGSKGDPLVCTVEDFWVLAGVVMADSNCVQTNEPRLYTNISFYKSWIEKSAISATASLGLSRLLPVMFLPLILLGSP
ncbi:serine protease 48 [Dasypus novemcinctus]|uniref:serine protease 48 n=1 Tax=Dasypus novemcinctus TaxID=9361 RepID=UPI00265F858A|nr:serine protease 48 [Dasypus novemcinctus]